ncbi:hypothetical protein ASG03_18385 [Rhizobium sp. Leaf341]|nr:hypothetical protein ASG03_18385 [Rhizobium sp. Leaf341]
MLIRRRRGAIDDDRPTEIQRIFHEAHACDAAFDPDFIFKMLLASTMEQVVAMRLRDRIARGKNSN